jgi:hypothetical protein
MDTALMLETMIYIRVARVNVCVPCVCLGLPAPPVKTCIRSACLQHRKGHACDAQFAWGRCLIWGTFDTTGPATAISSALTSTTRCRQTRPLARPPKGTQKKSLDADVA